MNVIRTIYHIARADLFERIRQYAFLVILGMTMLAAYFFVPPVDAGYVTLYLDNYRGVYNSAWVGGSVALSSTLVLALFGFYLVKNSIQRDRRSGVGHIIASTTVKKLHYLIGKWISNFAVLSIIVFVIILIALIMQWVRGEVMEVELWALLSPFLFLALPMMSVVAALAVLFETVRALQGSLGNIVYFVIFLIFSVNAFDMPFGTAVIMSDMVGELTSLNPDYSGSFGIGILIPEQPLKLFEWQGVEWTGTLMLQDLSLFLIAFALILVAVLTFRGFKEEANLTDKVEDNAAVETEGKNAQSASCIRASALTPVTVRESFLPLVLAEWRLMMKSVSLGWYVIAVLLAVLCLVMPVAVSTQWMVWPITWLWPIALWSGMGSREIRWQTQFLVTSSSHFVIRQLSAVWVAGLLLTCCTGLGMLIRLMIEGDLEHLGYWVSAVILIPSFALASGVLTKTNRTFEILYMIIWYLGPLNKMPFLDFLGSKSAEGMFQIGGIELNSWAMSLIYIMISLGLLSLAYASRNRLAQTA